MKQFTTSFLEVQRVPLSFVVVVVFFLSGLLSPDPGTAFTTPIRRGHQHRRRDPPLVTITTVHANNPWKIHDKDLLHRPYHPDLIPKDLVDYIIIGSGIGGLWLAACLAKFNQTSLVLEQHYTAGGFQHTFQIRGYEFIPGLHYIANLPLCGPLYDMVATTAPLLNDSVL
jgi:hypothetical protein